MAAVPNVTLNQQIETQAFLQENGVQIQAWAPFAEGRGEMFRNEVLSAIAEKHGKSVAQVILRWLTQRGVATIPKSVRRERMEENFNVFVHMGGTMTRDEELEVIRSGGIHDRHAEIHEASA